MARELVTYTDEMFEAPFEGKPWYKEGEYFVSRGNFELVDHSKDPAHVDIHDCTLRDGEQRPGICFTEDERVFIGEQLIDLGVDRMEAGMPIVSDIQFNAMKRICKLDTKNTKIMGFARALAKDIERVADTGAYGAVIEHCMDPQKCRYGYDLTPKKMVDRIVSACKRSRELGLFTVYMGWDWFRAPLDFSLWFINEVLQQVELDGLTIVDTTGCTLPAAVGAMFKAFHEQFPNLPLEFHGHNDFNLGVACSLEAINNGATRIHTAMNALGERTGNVATEEVVASLHILSGIKTGVDMHKINRVANVVAEIAKSPIVPSKPILGDANFIVENGVATDILFKMQHAGKASNPGNGPISTAAIGKAPFEIIKLGKNSGNSAIKLMLEKYNIPYDDELVKAVLADVKRESILIKNIVSEESFLAIVAKHQKK